MELDLEAPEAEDIAYGILSSIVVPRPIAWVTTLGVNGIVNAAPFSFYNLMGDEPPVVALGIGPTETGLKDSARNIRETGEFVINTVTEELMAAMTITAADFPPDESETTAAGLELLPSVKVRAPRLAAAPAHLECRFLQVVEIGRTHLTLGQVVHVHVDDRFFNALTGTVETERMGIVGRMHGRGWYARTTDLTEMQRIRYADRCSNIPCG